MDRHLLPLTYFWAYPRPAAATSPPHKVLSRGKLFYRFLFPRGTIKLWIKIKTTPRDLFEPSMGPSLTTQK